MLQVPNSQPNVLLIFRPLYNSSLPCQFVILTIQLSLTAKTCSVKALLNFLLYPAIDFPSIKLNLFITIPSAKIA